MNKKTNKVANKAANLLPKIADVFSVSGCIRGFIYEIKAPKKLQQKANNTRINFDL